MHWLSRASVPLPPPRAGVVLLAVALLWQGWLAARAAVPLPDCTRYVRMARSLQTQGLLSALVQHEDQPLFPVLIATVEPAIRPICPRPWRWLVAAQTVAALSAALATVVLWRLFRLLWSPRVAWAAALLAAVLPPVASMGAGATADAPALLFYLLALWLTCEAVLKLRRTPETHHPEGPTSRVRKQPDGLRGWGAAWRMMLAGASAALAWSCSRQFFILAALPAAACFVPGGAGSRWRQAKGMVLASAGFVLGAALVLGGWYLALRPAPVRAALGQVLGWSPRDWGVQTASQTSRQQQRHLARQFRWRTADGRKMAFWKKDPRHSIRVRELGPFLVRFARQLAQAYHYLPALLALVGLAAAVAGSLPSWCRIRRGALHRFLGGLWLLHLGLLFGGTWHVGYVSDRYLVPLAVLSLGWAVVGTAVLAGRLHFAWQTVFPRFAAAVRKRFPLGIAGSSQQFWFGVLLAGVLLSCVLKWRQAPQQSHLAHRQAAIWVGQHAPAGSSVLDTRGWSELFTPCKTYLLANGRQGLADPRLRFVLLERRELQSPSRRGQTLREVLQRAGTLVRVFPAPEGHTARDVLVFAWSPDRFALHYRRLPRGSPAGTSPRARVVPTAHRADWERRVRAAAAARENKPR